MKPPHLVHAGYTIQETGSSDPVRPIYYEQKATPMTIFEGWMRLKDFMQQNVDNDPNFTMQLKTLIHLMNCYEKEMPEYYKFEEVKHEQK